MREHLISLASSLLNSGLKPEAIKVYKIAQDLEGSAEPVRMIPTRSGETIPVDFSSNPLAKALWNYAHEVAGISYVDQSLSENKTITAKSLHNLIHQARLFTNTFEMAGKPGEFSDDVDVMHPDNFSNLVIGIFNTYYHESPHEISAEIWMEFVHDLIEYYAEEYFDSSHDELAYAKKVDQWFEDNPDLMDERAEGLLFLGRQRTKNTVTPPKHDPVYEGILPQEDIETTTFDKDKKSEEEDLTDAL